VRFKNQNRGQKVLNRGFKFAQGFNILKINLIKYLLSYSVSHLNLEGLSSPISDGVSRLGHGLETRFLKSRSRRSQVSVSKDFGLETLYRLFFMKFCKEFPKKTVLKNDCSKFSRSKRSAAKLSLLSCCLRDEENKVPSTPFTIYTEFNKKCACTNETAARIPRNERLGVLC